MPSTKQRTLTHDNGFEIQKHEQITGELRITVYCAHPYSSWERGTNENTNGLIRDFFPKGTDFSRVPPEELASVVELLNNRPRQSLNFLTPKEVFEMEVKGYAFHPTE
jgi:transposase, IS30 family